MSAPLTVSELSSDALKRALQGPGLGLRVGRLGLRVFSSLGTVRRGLQTLYHDYPVLEPGGFADFRARVDAPPGPRRWLRPQAQFYLGRVAPFQPLPRHHAVAMLEWGLNWCVSSHLHHYLVLHAAAAEREGRTYLFPGASGSGKSTLVAALMLSGWRLLTDELVLLDVDTGAVQPFPRPLGLKNAAIHVIQRDFPQAVLGEPVNDTTKGQVAHLRPSRRSIEQARLPGHIEAVVFPRYRPGVAAELEACHPADAFLALVNQSFNYQVLGERAFRLLSELVQRVPAYEVQYGTLDEGHGLIRTIDAQPPTS
ncbi:HprK-related kinase A [Aquisalimonas asiatica]|uniref:Hpr(Ser) kinase/phosphatase n=1 Tax=Aquisalimonas asiatica TaxID=406100 RepID=A0A1H8QHG6_9GAMM|nr:HprK-related kinase A [Aquisalimonas asiatica]SEO53357.1 Hpr(Ser) kinase/phosphatase [Aquisalimonas asiatica]